MDDVAIQKTVSPSGPFKVGSKVSYDIVVHNQGTDPIYNVAVSDYFPAVFDFFAADNAGNAFASNSTTLAGGVVSATVATATPIAAGGTLTLTIVLTINSSAVPGSALVNEAEVTGATEDEAGMRPISDEDDSLADTMGGTEDDNNIDDDALDDPNDQDDFDFATIILCNSNCGGFPWDGSK